MVFGLNPDQKFLRRLVKVGKRLQAMASELGDGILSQEKRDKMREIHDAESIAAHSKEDFLKIGKYIRRIKDRQDEIIQKFEKAEKDQELQYCQPLDDYIFLVQPQ